MTDKEKYTLLMERYFGGETTPEEEKALAAYVASVEDPDFEELRGVLGYLSIGREMRQSKIRRIRWHAVITVAASLAAILTVGIVRSGSDTYVRYAFGEKTTDSELVMETVNNSLADFFTQGTQAEVSLEEIFNR